MSIIVKEDGQLANLPFIEKQSGLMRRFISRKPSLIIRLALIFFMAIMFVVAAIAWLVPYPDIIQSSAVVSQNEKGDSCFAEIILSSNEVKQVRGSRQLRVSTAKKNGFMPATLISIVTTAIPGENKALLQWPGKTHDRGIKTNIAIAVNDLKLIQRIFHIKNL